MRSSNRKVKRMRMTRGFKLLLTTIAFLVIILCISVYALSYETPEQPQYGNIQDVTTSDEQGEIGDLEVSPLTFIVIDVGQGQSLFIDYEDTEVLIDAGYPDKGEKVANTIRKYVDDNIEYAIATHSHADHIGGFSAIYDEFTVEKTIYGDLSNETACKIFEEQARKEGEFVNDENTFIKLGKNASLTIYDLVDDDPNTNNNSIVCLLQHGENSFFFSGDLEADLEVTLRNTIPKCTVVVAGHHGANTSNTLLDVLEPQYFVISAASNNEYGHPHQTVMESALEYANYIYGTWKSGNITFTSDGVSLSTDADENDLLSLDDVGAAIKKKTKNKN